MLRMMLILLTLGLPLPFLLPSIALTMEVTVVKKELEPKIYNDPKIVYSGNMYAHHWIMQGSRSVFALNVLLSSYKCY